MFMRARIHSDEKLHDVKCFKGNISQNLKHSICKITFYHYIRILINV